MIIFFLQVSMTHPLIISRIPAFTSLLHNKDQNDKQATSSLPGAQKPYINGSFLLQNK